jgi:hypothetical protein
MIVAILIAIITTKVQASSPRKKTVILQTEIQSGFE